MIRMTPRLLLIGLLLLPDGCTERTTTATASAQPAASDAEITRAEQVAERGEQLWAEEVTQIIRRLESATTDKHLLAEQLLRSKCPSIRAEGLVLAVRYEHPQADAFIASLSRDTEPNYFLRTNAEIADEAKRVLRIRRSNRRTAGEELELRRWLDKGPS